MIDFMDPELFALIRELQRRAATAQNPKEWLTQVHLASHFCLREAEAEAAKLADTSPMVGTPQKGK
jgi:hypothetical protein